MNRASKNGDRPRRVHTTKYCLPLCLSWLDARLEISTYDGSMNIENAGGKERRELRKLLGVVGEVLCSEV